MIGLGLYLCTTPGDGLQPEHGLSSCFVVYIRGSFGSGVEVAERAVSRWLLYASMDQFSSE